MSDDESMVMSMLGCTHDEAKEYLAKTGGDVLEAVTNNMKVVQVSGEKYIPPPPKIDDGLTEEVRLKLTEARKLSEAFSASFRNDLRGVPAKKSDEVAELSVPEVPSLPVVQPEVPVVDANEIHPDA